MYNDGNPDLAVELPVEGSVSFPIHKCKSDPIEAPFELLPDLKLVVVPVLYP
jgi:hypothetical protein